MVVVQILTLCRSGFPSCRRAVLSHFQGLILSRTQSGVERDAWPRDGVICPLSPCTSLGKCLWLDGFGLCGVQDRRKYFWLRDGWCLQTILSSCSVVLQREIWGIQWLCFTVALRVWAHSCGGDLNLGEGNRRSWQHPRCVPVTRGLHSRAGQRAVSLAVLLSLPPSAQCLLTALVEMGWYMECCELKMPLASVSHPPQFWKTWSWRSSAFGRDLPVE